MLEAEGSKIQNSSCQQMNNHLSWGGQACSPLTLIQEEQQEDRQVSLVSKERKEKLRKACGGR